MGGVRNQRANHKVTRGMKIRVHLFLRKEEPMMEGRSTSLAKSNNQATKRQWEEGQEGRRGGGIKRTLSSSAAVGRRSASKFTHEYKNVCI